MRTLTILLISFLALAAFANPMADLNTPYNVLRYHLHALSVGDFVEALALCDNSLWADTVFEMDDAWNRQGLVAMCEGISAGGVSFEFNDLGSAPLVENYAEAYVEMGVPQAADCEHTLVELAMTTDSGEIITTEYVYLLAEIEGNWRVVYWYQNETGEGL
ncbi:hypothetical protein K8R78_04870 [bacterium]|nr:hypothetical protein [bacterium]